jgi:hypothetical protein
MTNTNTTTGTSLLVAPPLPETLSPSTQSLIFVMETAVSRYFSEDVDFQKLLETIQSQQSVTGSVGNDNTYAALKLHGWAKATGGYEAIVELDIKEFISLFRKARRKLGVDSAKRLKLAKEAAAQAAQQAAQQAAA